MQNQPSQNIRRQLFESDRGTDIIANKLREIIDQDRQKMIKKYNFDPKHEEPLEGPYKWYEGGRHDWIGVKSQPVHGDNECSEKNHAVATPHNSIEVEVATPKKRRESTENRPEGVEEVKKELDI